MTSVTTPYGITALTLEDLEKLNVNTVLTHSFTDGSVKPIQVKPIQGEPIVVELTLNESELEWLQDSERKIKHGLVQKLAEAMHESGKYIEFTRQELINEQRIVFRARIFVTPGDMVQLLRTNGTIK